MNRNDKVSITYGLLVDTADAIRSQKGTSSLIDPSDFPSTISSIDGRLPIELKMTFKNNTPSSAYGEIVLLAKESQYSGNYDIMWADSNGALSDYTKIDSVTLDVVNGKTMDSIKLMEFNAIPSDATRLVAVKNNTIVTSYSIPASKLSNEEADYVFNAFSDAHRQYETAEQDIAKMLTISKNDADVVGSFGAGDLTSNGTVANCDEWLATRDAYRGTKRVCTCNGNHEARNSSSICTTNPNDLRKYLDTDWTNETEAYFYKEIEGDIFVFVPCFLNTTWESSKVLFSEATLNWLGALLERYRNQRVFLFAHIPPRWDTAGLKTGGLFSGFATGNGAYSFDNWGSNKADRNQFMAFLDHYKNVIWFSGHSHIKYEYQKLWEMLNVWQYKGGARFVHLSSLAVPRDILNGSITDQIYAEAEFTRVEVYDNYIRLRSYNLITDKYYGLCEYIIDTTPVTIPPSSKTLVSISAVKTKTSYYTDESASGITDDITVTATWSDSTTSTVNNSDVVFDTSNVDISTAGTYSIGIEYTYGEDTETTSIQITSTVRPSVKTLTSITASKLTTSYAVDASLETNDITAVATYSDDTTSNIPNSSLSFDTSNVDMATVGAYVIVVSYTEDGVTATTSIGITVSGDGDPEVIVDATFNGTLTAKGESIIPVINDNKGEVYNTEYVLYNDSTHALSNKSLYYRWLSNTGISSFDKIGIYGEIKGSPTSSGGTKVANYDITKTSWTKLVQASNDKTAHLTDTNGNLVLICRASSSSTATFPVSVNARLQIGYKQTVEPDMTVALDATFRGTLSQAGEEISSITINNSHGTAKGGSGHTWAYVEGTNLIGKTLYYRVLDATGLGETEKIGFIAGTGEHYYTQNGQTNTSRGLLASDWTVLKDNNNFDVESDSTYHYINVTLNASSSSPATFPVSVNARLQIGYMNI